MHKALRASLILLACVLASFEAVADDGKPPHEFPCRWADEPIRIDGVADEAAWTRAEVIDEFSLPWLGQQARPARSATRARTLWDRENLYFFADMDDTDLYADVREHDGETWFNDVFELFFKPAADKPGYYEFQVNAAGTVMDMFLPRRGSGGFRRFIKDGEFHIEAKVKLRGTLNHWQDKDQGWSVEGRIPWRDFLRTGGRPEIDERWRFALCRYDYSVDFEGPELSTCAPLASKSSPDFHHHEDYATLHFIGPSKPDAARAHGIPSYTPVTTSRLVGSPEPPSPYRVRRALPNLQLSFPITMANEPGSRRLLWIEQPWSYGPARLCRSVGDPADSPWETLMEFDGGIGYSMAFHPRFAENGHLFIGSNGPGAGGEKTTRVTRYTIERKPPFAFRTDTAKVIIEWLSDGHNGGAVVFGRDGMLYVTSGDGTSDSDTNVVGQRLDLLLGKVLRIDVDHPDQGRGYSVPADNPFVDVPEARPETWAYGLRNPWRIALNPRTGQLWVGNNGQDLWEQVYLIERGANYGWSVYEGSHPFYPNRPLGPTPVLRPTLEHPHSEARSLTGGVVYHGRKLPKLRDAYLYGDYSTGKIWAAKVREGDVDWHQELVDTTLQITAFALDADGELLIADHRGKGEGGFYSLEEVLDEGHDAEAARSAALEFPRTLSASGLFTSVPDHRMVPGVIPYSVNSPLWSDGAHKERFMALPGRQPKIDLTSSRGWEFPDRTVLIKSFALEMEEGDPDSRRWIETRFLTRQDGEWVGYSYAWNDQQTDATLVAREGQDVEFLIHTAEGVRRQPWRYPSRTECMVCHSRAANFVLGPSTLQMNKDHDYGGVVDNQLRVLEHLGLLRVNWSSEMTSHLRNDLQREGKTRSEIDEQLRQWTATRDQREPVLSSLLFQPPERYPRLADPYDRAESLDARARSYLHANCAHCHVEAGGGNAQMQLEFTTPLSQMKVVGEVPLHHKFDLPDARLIAPGAPDRSVLYHRLAHRGPGQMPQLATTMIDQSAVDLFRQWISRMREEDCQ